MEPDQAKENPFAKYAAGSIVPMSEEESAEQQYIEQAGIPTAILAGIAEGITFGWSDEIQEMYEKAIGAVSQPGYLSPQAKTQALKTKFPGSYQLADIAGSLATAALPVPGTGARIATRIGAEALKGGVEAAGRAKEGQRFESAVQGAGIGAGIGALRAGIGKYLEKGKEAKEAEALIKAGKAASQTTEGKALKAIEDKLNYIDKELLTLPAKKEAQKIKQAMDIDSSILKAEQEIAELEAKGFVPGLDEAKKELASLRQTLEQQTESALKTERQLSGDVIKTQREIAELEAKGVTPGLSEAEKELEGLRKTLSQQTGAVQEAEQQLAGIGQKFQVDPKDLAKMEEQILKGREEVARLEAAGVAEVPRELLEQLAKAEKAYADATRRVQAAEKGVFDVGEEMARLFVREEADAAKQAAQMGLFGGAPPTGNLPAIAAARGEQMAIGGLRQEELAKRIAEQGLSFKAVKDLEMAIAQAKKQAPKQPVELPFARERLARAEAAPVAAQEAMKAAMEAEAARLQSQIASGQASKQETQKAVESLIAKIEELVAGPKQMPVALPFKQQELKNLTDRLESQIASGKASREETQNAIDMLMTKVDELTAAPKQMPTALPFKQQELAGLMARKAAPEAVPAEILERTLRAEIPQLDQQRTLARQMFNKKLEELSEVEMSALQKVLQLTVPGTKATRPFGAVELGEAAGRTAAARNMPR